MACPNAADDEISMFKTGRERTGAGYDSSYNLSTPVYMSDIQRLSGGSTSGSGQNYPSVNTLNPVENRPDGENPLGMSEFSEYNQNVTRSAFNYVYSSSSSSNACQAAIPSPTPYFHTDVNNLVPDAGGGQYTAYTTISGSNVVAAGYYSIYGTGNFPSASGKWMQVGNNGSILAVGNC
jgi:hypothetical protein|tara:strand:- start:425 stop:961 length:537 start_codon:yes stop_codon:yes gene_type:complete